MKAPKVKRVKAERIRHYWSGYDAGFYEERWSLPADAESYERMVEQIAKVFACESDDGTGNAMDSLRAIGITAPKRGKKGSK